MTADVSKLREKDDAASQTELISLGKTVQVGEGEFVPMAMTIEFGRSLKLSIPLGAFTVRDNRSSFVSTVDVVGLTAAIMGIGVGALGVRAIRPVFSAIADRIRKT